MKRIVSLHNLVLAPLLLALLVVTGCGDKKKKTPAPKPTQASAEPTGEQPEDDKQPEAIKKPRVKWVKVSVRDAVEKSVKYMDRLVREGEYEKALQRAEELVESAIDDEKEGAKEYLEGVKAVAETASKIDPEIVKLKDGNADAEAAIKAAGDNGLLVIRKHIRKSQDPTAVVNYAVKADDAMAAHAILARWKSCRDPKISETLGNALKELVAKHSEDALETELLLNMLLFANYETDPKRSDELRTIAGAWRFSKIPKQKMQGFLGELAGDKKFEKIHLADLLHLAYEQCGKDKSRFAALFQGDPMQTINAYIIKGSGAPTAPVRDWAKAMSPKFGFADFAALENLLVMYFSFNEPRSARSFRDVNQPKRFWIQISDKIRGCMVPRGLQGNALNFNGRQNLQLPSKMFRMAEMPTERITLMRSFGRSYSYSVWIKPTEYPRSVGVVVGKEQKTIGLVLANNGRVQMLHPGAAPASSSVAVPKNRWSHVAGIVDHENGKVRVYVNGKRVGNRSFAAGAEVPAPFGNAMYTVLGAAGPYRASTDPETLEVTVHDNFAFIGLVDEFRLYFRPLTDQDVKSIYELHAK